MWARKGEHNPGRVANRHGRENGSMTLGGRRVAVSWPRMRAAGDSHELPVQTYAFFADRDPPVTARPSEAPPPRDRARPLAGGELGRSRITTRFQDAAESERAGSDAAFIGKAQSRFSADDVATLTQEHPEARRDRDRALTPVAKVHSCGSSARSS